MSAATTMKTRKPRRTLRPLTAAEMGYNAATIADPEGAALRILEFCRRERHTPAGWVAPPEVLPLLTALASGDVVAALVLSDVLEDSGAEYLAHCAVATAARGIRHAFAKTRDAALRALITAYARAVGDLEDERASNRAVVDYYFAHVKQD